MEGTISAGFLFLGSVFLLCFSNDLLFIVAALVAAGTGIYLLWALISPILDSNEKNESEGETDEKP